jgi:hypothetical protein
LKEQKQESQKTSNNQMAESTGASSSKDSNNRSKPLTIQRFKKIDVFKEDNKLHRVCICAINDCLSVGLSKFWLFRQEEKWLPSKKGHFYMNAAQWRQFAQHVPAITQSLNKIERENRDQAWTSTGTQ